MYHPQLNTCLVTSLVTVGFGADAKEGTATPIFAINKEIPSHLLVEFLKRHCTVYL